LISDASREQALGIEQVNSGVIQISRVAVSRPPQYQP
jgi:methyl-accepting chemotaxis protein